MSDAEDPYGGIAWPPLRRWGEHDLPEFPVHALPKAVGDWAAHAAVAYQVPVDLPAMVALAALAAAAVGKAEGEPRDGWREVLALYVLVALDSGEKKSPVFAAATRSIYTYQRERAAREAAERHREADRHEVAEERVKAAKVRLAKRANPTDKDEAEYDAAVDALLATPAPRPPYRLVADDCTPERLAELIARHGSRFAILSPEGGGLAAVDGRRYSKTGEPSYDVLLKSHAGDPFSLDRKSGGVSCDRPVLVLGLAVQPQVLRALVAEPSARGVGLLARFLFAVPRPFDVKAIRPPAIPPDVDAAYQFMLSAVLELDPPAPVVVRFAMDADAALEDFEREIEPRRRRDGDLYALRDWASKLPGAVVRLAVLFAVAEFARRDRVPPRVVDRDHVLRAAEVGRYVVEHARVALGAIVEPEHVTVARRILTWAERSGRTEFSARDAFLAVKGGGASVRRMEDVEPALDELVERGYIAPVSVPSANPQFPQNPGRPRSATYVLRPSAPSVPSEPRVLRDVRDEGVGISLDPLPSPLLPSSGATPGNAPSVPSEGSEATEAGDGGDWWEA